MKLPEIFFVASHSRYIISPCGNCNEIKGCLYLLDSADTLSETHISLGSSTCHLILYFHVISEFSLALKKKYWFRFLHLACRWGGPRVGGMQVLEKRLPAACPPCHHLPDTDQNLLTSVAHYKLILPQSCPLGNQEWGGNERPWLNFFFFFAFNLSSLVHDRLF